MVLLSTKNIYMLKIMVRKYLQFYTEIFSWSKTVSLVIEPWHEISNKLVCATNKASDQPANTRRLIRAFASRLHILGMWSYWLNIIGVSKLKRWLHRLVRVYTCQHATMLEISCRGSFVLENNNRGAERDWWDSSFSWRCCQLPQETVWWKTITSWVGWDLSGF